MKKQLNIKLYDLKDILNVVLKYKFLIYLIFIFILYGYLFLKINNLNQPNANIKSSPQSNSVLTPQEIQPNIVNKLLSLKNNNVQVKALFENSRSNPF
jgi:hypothetical protein